MADDEQEGQPAPGEPSAAPVPDTPAPAAESLTEHGYAYSVVGADADVIAAPAAPVAGRERHGLSLPWVAGLVVVTAVVAAVGAWFGAMALDDDSGGGGSAADVGSVLNAFTAGQGSDVVKRYEGATPPGYPSDIPVYPGAEVVASVLQIGGEDAAHLVVLHTDDARDDVAAYYQDALDADPWQVDGAQDARDSSVRRFTKIDDPDIEGIVLAAESADRAVTTIFLSVQVVGGAADADLPPFEAPVTRPLPPEFPGEFPQFPDSIIIQTAYQRAPSGNTHALSLIARTDATAAVDFYREELTGAGYTVEDASPEGSGLEEAVAVSFLSEDGETSGTVVSGNFTEDRNYVQIDVQVSAPR